MARVMGVTPLQRVAEPADVAHAIVFLASDKARDDHRPHAAGGRRLPGAVTFVVAAGDQKGNPMNPNKALWEKGDFTRIAENMRESGEDLVESLGIKPGMKVLDLGCGDGTTALPAAQLGADVLGVDIARNLVDAGNRRAAGRGARQPPLPGRRRLRPAALGRRELRPRRQHLRRHVRAQAVRRGQGDGARDPARRPHRHGQLDPQRPDAGRADPEDQLGLFAAAARGLRQPDDLGRGEQRDRALPRGRRSGGAISCVRDTYTFDFHGTPAEFVDAFREYYGPTMNAFEAAGKSGRAEPCRPSWRRCSRARTRADARIAPSFRRPSCA